MRKMTICRSNGLLVIPVAALLLTAPAAAQDSLTTDGSRVHIVREGETLWTLAEFYMGDPYLWPHIYRINPHVVEDPHWIFPGESLLLIPPDTVMVTRPPVEDPGQDQTVVDSSAAEPEDVPQEEAAPPPPPPAAIPGAGTVFATNRFRGGTPTGAMRAISRNPSRMAFYASGFLTEKEELPWAHIAGAIDQTTLGSLTATSAANINEHVSVTAPAGATYQVGDSLLSARLSREVVGWGNVIKPSGILLVTAVSGREVLARVIAQFGRVADGQVALPVDPYRDVSTGRTVPIENGMFGEIITTRDQNTVPNQHEVMFIDQGRSDGVALGDVFELYVEREGFPGTGGRTVAELTIVHLRDRSATGQITHIQDIGFGAGTHIRLIRRAGP